MSTKLLYCGDSLEIMKILPDKSIDLILVDLPYGTTCNKTDCNVDIDNIWQQYNRIIKDTGVVCMFGSEPFSSMLRMANINNFKYDWIWKKNNCTGFVHAKNMPLKNHEIISVFSKASMGHNSILGDKRMPYNPQGIMVVNKRSKAGHNKFGSVVGKRPSHKDVYITEAKGYPKSVLEFRNNEKQFHPFQKPIPLLDFLIRTYTEEGDTVLDSHMGSGSTGVAALQSGRNFIGIEIDEEYYNIANDRMNCIEM